MEKQSIGWRLAVAGWLLLGALAAPAGAVPTAVAACGVLPGPGSYILTADLNGTPGAACLTVGNGATINLNGHSIRGDLSGAVGTSSIGIRGTPGNNVTIQGPGIVHDFDTCIILGNYTLVENVLAYNCPGGIGILLGDASKCVECRVHDVRVGGAVGGFGIFQGSGCLLESSIVELSDNGARVGQDCKVWDLVVDGIGRTGLQVGAGTSVARTVISHVHDGPGLDYTACTIIAGVAGGCQDSSNSVWPADSVGAVAILDSATARVITDCATNRSGSETANVSTKYIPTAPVPQCPVPQPPVP